MRVVAAVILLLVPPVVLPSEAFRLEQPTPSAAGFVFTFPTVSNRTYAVNWSTLRPPNIWNTLTNVHGRGSTAQIHDPAVGGPMRFYRAFAEAPLRYLTLGHVGPTTARFAVGLDRSRSLTILYSTNANLNGATAVGTFHVSVAEDYTRAIDLSGFRPDTLYFYNITVDGAPYYAPPYPNFRTAVPPGTAGTVRFAFGSCFTGTTAGGEGTIASTAAGNANRVWEAISTTSPKFFLHLGDTAYCDNMNATDLASYRLVHRHALDGRLANMAGYAEFRRHFPFYSTWDDHELRNDWPWSPLMAAPWNPTYFPMGKLAFLEYPGRGNPDPLVSGELYYTFQFGDVGVFVTDTRSFRSCQQGEDSLADISSEEVAISFSGSLGTALNTNWNRGLGFTPGLIGRTLRLSNGQTRYITARHSAIQISVSAPVPSAALNFSVLGKTILGATQKQHLKNWLLQNNDTLRVKFIASATPINGLSEHITRQDAWGNGYQAELNELLDFIVTYEIHNVVFLTGDQHWSGCFNRRRGNLNFFEFMSSPIYSFGYPRYTGDDASLLSRANWMFDVTMGSNGAENFGLVTVRTDTSPAIVHFELLDAQGTRLNSTLLRESSSGLVLVP